MPSLGNLLRSLKNAYKKWNWSRQLNFKTFALSIETGDYSNLLAQNHALALKTPVRKKASLVVSEFDV